MTEFRAELSGAQISNLPDSAFAYIESGGKKDADGKTAPRKLRHCPIQDKPHADDALSRANAQLKGDDDNAKTIAEAALPKIKAAVKKFADAEEQKAAVWDAQKRDGDPSYEDLRELLSSAVSAEYAKKEEEYTYIVDFSDDWVVFSKKGEKYECSYELGGTDVTLGKAALVTAVTKYVPIQNNSASVQSNSEARNPATPKRAFSSLVEVAPPHVIDAQVRMQDDTTTANFVGYAYTIDERYGVTDFLGKYKERIGPGASSKTLREQSSIPLLLNHDGLPMANTSSNTSRLSDDGNGLRNEADFDRRQGLTNDVCIALQRGDINKMSFSFRATKEEWNDTYDDRYVTELRLYDTSIVTYPANPATSAELVEEMRSAMGREGRSLWLAEHELSMRSVLPAFVEHREVPADTDDLLERALRALEHADEVVCRSKGPHGRARTFQVAQAMLELRAGKALSAKNQGLVQSALDALSAADKQHAKVASSHAKASDALSTVLNGSAEAAAQDGKDGNQGAGNGAPINPQDGAGPRAASLKLQRQREAELRALRR